MLNINIDDVQSAVRGHIASRLEENGGNLKVSVTHLHARTHTHRKLLVAALVSCITYDFTFPVYVHTSHNKQMQKFEWHHVKQSAAQVCALQPSTELSALLL